MKSQCKRQCKTWNDYVEWAKGNGLGLGLQLGLSQTLAKFRNACAVM